MVLKKVKKSVRRRLLITAAIFAVVSAIIGIIAFVKFDSLHPVILNYLYWGSGGTGLISLLSVLGAIGVSQ